MKRGYYWLIKSQQCSKSDEKRTRVFVKEDKYYPGRFFGYKISSIRGDYRLIPIQPAHSDCGHCGKSFLTEDPENTICHFCLKNGHRGCFRDCEMCFINP